MYLMEETMKGTGQEGDEDYSPAGVDTTDELPENPKENKCVLCLAFFGPKCDGPH